MTYHKGAIKLARLLAMLTLVLIFASAPAPAAAAPVGPADLAWLTEQYPPFNFEENGKLQGISVDLLMAMMKKMNANFAVDKIRLTTWTEAYQAVLKNKNTCLFVNTRTPEREKMFKWVGPIAPTKIAVLTRKDKALKISSPADLKKYKFAALKDDIGETLLLKAGVSASAIIVKEKADDVIRLMENGTVDAWAYEETAGLWLIRRQAAKTSVYQSVYSLYEGELYFSFSPDTPKEVIVSLQKALDDLKKEKTAAGPSVYQTILNRYTKP